MAAHKVKDVRYQSINEKEGKISILFNKVFDSNPDLTIKGKTIQVALPETMVWPKIEKKASISKSFDTTLMAYQFNKNLTRFRVILPYNLKEGSNKVYLKLNGKKLDIIFPLASRNKLFSNKKLERKPAIKGKATIAKGIDRYDEKYLEKLLKDREEVVGKAPLAENKKDFDFKSPEKAKVDQVKMALAAPAKDAKAGGFSLWKYIGKFIAFLGLILLLFYGVVALMKKGVIKKGKLGFLNSTKLVEVLSTTYVGPKRNLLVVKAHNQVFLVGSSENGLNFLSEIDDVSGLLKEGEKQVVGDNFDIQIGEEVGNEKSFRLKGEKSSPAAEAATEIEDKVKLSDQIKNKVKGLKSLQ